MTTLLTRTSAAASEASTRMPVREPAAAFDGTTAERMVLAVAPTTGRFRPADEVAHAVHGAKAAHARHEGHEGHEGRAAQGRTVPAGRVLGHVTGGRGRADAVMAPSAGRVHRLLARPGQLVFAGQALVWMERPAVDVEVAANERLLAGEALR